MTPCNACARHVKAEDARCPFCSARVEHSRARHPSLTTTRDRAALLFGAAALAGTIASVGCKDKAETDYVAHVPPYGTAVPDRPVIGEVQVSDASMESDAGLAPPSPDAGPKQAPSAVDAGARPRPRASTDAGATPDPFTMVALYGNPFIGDAGLLGPK